MGLLAEDNGIRPWCANPGLVATHIDSWEVGSQNWTPKFREEFKRRRGYGLIAVHRPIRYPVSDRLSHATA